MVNTHLEKMSAVDVQDPASANQALAHALSAVGAMNSTSAPVGTTLSMGLSPVDGIVERLEEWLSRLVDKLTEIAEHLRATFSISVGTSVTVSITCNPFSDVT